MLEVEHLQARYGAIQAVRDVSFRLDPGEVLAVLGANGAGKSTLAGTLAGLHPARSGSVRLRDTDLSDAGPTRRARSGITVVPQGRRVFGSCTVAEHVGLADARARAGALELDELLGLFPRLRDRWHVRARELSGGEQQMLAITRAVLLGPVVLILDEPTEGLAPSIVSAVGGLVRRLSSRGVAVLLMERPGAFPEALAHRVVAMDRGLFLDEDRRPPTRGQVAPQRAGGSRS
jgi:branched-chain amino acid transport system ATP-binding protein